MAIGHITGPVIRAGKPCGFFSRISFPFVRSRFFFETSNFFLLYLFVALVVQTVRRATRSLFQLWLFSTRDRQTEKEKERESSDVSGVLLAVGLFRRTSKHFAALHNSVTQTNGKFELPCDGNRLQFDEIAGSTWSEREHRSLFSSFSSFCPRALSVFTLFLIARFTCYAVPLSCFPSSTRDQRNWLLLLLLWIQ